MPLAELLLHVVGCDWEVKWGQGPAGRRGRLRASWGSPDPGRQRPCREEVQVRPLETLAGLVPGLTPRCPQGHKLEGGEHGDGSQGSVNTPLAQGAMMKDLAPQGPKQSWGLRGTETKAGE